MPSLITEPQHAALLREGARNMGFPVESLDQLTRANATKMLNRLDELNDPKRKIPR